MSPPMARTPSPSWPAAMVGLATPSSIRGKPRSGRRGCSSSSSRSRSPPVSPPRRSSVPPAASPFSTRRRPRLAASPARCWPPSTSSPPTRPRRRLSPVLCRARPMTALPPPGRFASAVSQRPSSSSGRAAPPSAAPRARDFSRRSPSPRATPWRPATASTVRCGALRRRRRRLVDHAEGRRRRCPLRGRGRAASVGPSRLIAALPGFR